MSIVLEKNAMYDVYEKALQFSVYDQHNASLKIPRRARKKSYFQKLLV